MAQIKVNGQDTEFKLDTGAEASAVTQATCQTLGINLSKPQKVLYEPSQTPLKVVGEFQGRLECKGKETIQFVYVVAHLKRNPLGLLAIKALNLAVRESMIMSNSANCSVIDKFSSLLQGLGSFGVDNTIKLKDGAKLFAIFTLRHIPIPLHTRVTQELDKMEAMQVISTNTLVYRNGCCAEENRGHTYLC